MKYLIIIIKDEIIIDPNLNYNNYTPDPSDLVISRSNYANKLYGFWLGQCIANWTGLVTEMDKIGNIGEIKTGKFYTRKDWGKPDQPNIWSNGKPSDLSSTIDFVFVDKGDIWVQKHFKLPYPITSGVAHEILREEIVKIFNDNWNKILVSKIKPKKQKKGGNFYSKFELDTPEKIKIKKGSSEDSLLRKIASRNFRKKSFIKIQIGNNEKFVHLEFSDDGILED